MGPSAYIMDISKYMVPLTSPLLLPQRFIPPMSCLYIRYLRILRSVHSRHSENFFTGLGTIAEIFRLLIYISVCVNTWLKPMPLAPILWVVPIPNRKFKGLSHLSISLPSKCQTVICQNCRIDAYTLY